jgi:hypothetical protein
MTRRQERKDRAVSSLIIQVAISMTPIPEDTVKPGITGSTSTGSMNLVAMTLQSATEFIRDDSPDGEPRPCTMPKGHAGNHLCAVDNMYGGYTNYPNDFVVEDYAGKDACDFDPTIAYGLVADS